MWVEENFCQFNEEAAILLYFSWTNLTLNSLAVII